MPAETVLALGEEPDRTVRAKKLIGDRIRDHRRTLKMSLDELAAVMVEVGRRNDPDFTITAAAIGMWERGETSPRLQFQFVLAECLRTTHDRLFNLKAA